jgi:hypothetical protein
LNCQIEGVMQDDAPHHVVSIWWLLRVLCVRSKPGLAPRCQGQSLHNWDPRAKQIIWGPSKLFYALSVCLNYSTDVAHYEYHVWLIPSNIMVEVVSFHDWPIWFLVILWIPLVWRLVLFIPLRISKLDSTVSCCMLYLHHCYNFHFVHRSFDCVLQVMDLPCIAPLGATWRCCRRGSVLLMGWLCRW